MRYSGYRVGPRFARRRPWGVVATRGDRRHQHYFTVFTCLRVNMIVIPQPGPVRLGLDAWFPHRLGCRYTRQFRPTFEMSLLEQIAGHAQMPVDIVIFPGMRWLWSLSARNPSRSPRRSHKPWLVDSERFVCAAPCLVPRMCYSECCCSALFVSCSGMLAHRLLEEFARPVLHVRKPNTVRRKISLQCLAPCVVRARTCDKPFARPSNHCPHSSHILETAARVQVRGGRCFNVDSRPYRIPGPRWGVSSPV